MTETRINDVRRILEDYYTPERVDVTLEGYEVYKVLIWFPIVTVTNEKNQSITIRDLYVKLRVTESGKLIGTFTMGRTTFTRAEANSHYVHSHCSGSVVPGVENFSTCCLGTGPLVSTTSSLNREFNEGLWQLFCAELDLYTQTESEEGVPYRHLNQVGASNYCIFNGNLMYNMGIGYYPRNLENLIKDATLTIIHDNLLPITFNNGVYTYAIPDIEVFLIINKVLYEKYDELPQRLKPSIYIQDGISYNGKVYGLGGYRNSDDFNNSYITFKGERKPVVIIEDDSNEQRHPIKVCESHKIMFIASLILETVNIGFGNG